MRKKLLLSTAALLAGVAIASAQDMGGKPAGQSGAVQGGAQTERGSAGASHEQMQRGESKQGQEKKHTTGQAQPGQHEQKAQQGQAEQGKQGQSPQRSQAQGKREQTTGQAQPSQHEQKAQRGQAQQGKEQGKQGQAQQRSQPKQQQETTGQAPQRQQGQQAPQQGQAGQQGQSSGQTGSSATGQPGSSATGASGSVNLTAQQRTKIQQTVLAVSNVPRANNVNFALSVGTAVPTSVRVVEVVPALIEINPAWRGHQYFVVRDEIVIVDHSRKIVAVVPVGSGGASLGGRGSTASNLSSDEIREVQTVLKERGFDVVVDGAMGSRTMRAITAFQRKEGFKVSGRIDSQTITALGLSSKIGAEGGAQGAATTGQGGSASGQGGASQHQAPAQQNQGAKPSTSGQSGASQAPAQQNQGANKPATSGQAPKQGAGEAKPSTSGQSGASQAPAQHNQGSKGSSTSGQSGMPAQQNENEKK
jgi:Protein of unknown function (DUF1236)/Putative peptidoglycan binding domain